MARRQGAPSKRQNKGIKPPKNDLFDDYSYEEEYAYLALEDDLTASKDKTVVFTKRSKKKRSNAARREGEQRQQRHKEHEEAITRQWRQTLIAMTCVKIVMNMVKNAGFTAEEKEIIFRDLYGNEEFTPEGKETIYLDIFGHPPAQPTETPTLTIEASPFPTEPHQQ